jgi:hypothetical protein
METINLRFTLDRCANIEDLLDSDDIFQVISQPDCFQVIVEDIDEELIESLNPDELAEFFGIDAEFVVAVEVN